MLFDLRSRGRRRTVQAIYVWLAILMGGGLILFGVGGATSGGLLDAFRGGGGASSPLQQNVEQAHKRVEQHPRSAAAWAQLTRAQYQAAGVGENFDQATGTFTNKGVAELRQASRSWQHYLRLTRNPDPNLANQMVQAYVALNQPANAVAAQEIVIDARPPSYGLYATLAQLAYAAGQTRKGDLAAQRAVQLAPKDQRSVLRQRLRQAKQQAASGTQSPTATTG